MDRVKLELVRARKEDLPLVVRWVKALFDEHPGPLPVDVEKVEETWRYFARHPNEGGVFLLEREGTPCGYLIAASYWSNEYGGRALIIDELYVDAPWRGQGVGAEAIGQCATLLPGAKAEVLLLEVDDDNPRAYRLYESLGFRRTGRHHLRRLLGGGAHRPMSREAEES